MRVRLAPRAASELDELLDYVAAQDEATAKAMAFDVKAALARISLQPKIGTITDLHNVFRLLLRKSKLAVFYRVYPRKREIVIMWIVRGSRVRRLASPPQA